MLTGFSIFSKEGNCYLKSMKNLIPKDIAGRAKILDSNLGNKKQEIKSDRLNPYSRTTQKELNFPYRSSRVFGEVISGSKKSPLKIHYELDLEKDIAVLKYEGEFKKYSKSVMKKAQKLYEKGFRIDEGGWKSLFPRGMLAILAGLIILEKYPDLALVIVIYGFYEMEKLGSLDDDSVMEYLEEKRCKKCGRNLASEEIKKPEVREISTTEDYEILIKRFQKCKYCGHEITEEGSEGFDTVKTNTSDSSRKILGIRPRCTRCKRKNAYEEFRKGDIRTKDSIRTTTKYYRCRYCENIELKIKTENIEYVDMGS